LWLECARTVAARDFAAQVRQALLNIVEILGQAKAKPEHIARMTWYVLDKSEYMAAAKEMVRLIERSSGDTIRP